MASIRRTLSPYRERPYQNGGSPFSVNSPSHKLISNAKNSSSLSKLGIGLRKFVAGILLPKSSRKGAALWKRSFYHCLLFFLLGFLLGMAPFGNVEELGNREFSFEIKRRPVDVQVNDVVIARPPPVDVQEDVKDVVIARPPPVDVEENVKDVVIARPDNLVVDSVEFGVEKISNSNVRFDFTPKKQLIVVTPTYERALQAYYLNRLGQLLRLVPPPLIWIVVEMDTPSMETAEILRKTGTMYRHLVCPKNSTNIKDRGVHQRNRALGYIEHHKLDGIVYFADDDNIYSLELFDRIREISRFGTWPVAMLAQSKAKAILEGPVCNGSQVIGWNTNEKSKLLRRFHVDMSGFAFNSTILWDPKRWHRQTSDPVRQLDTVKEGFQETTFIEQVVEDESQMEGIPAGCSKIMNWHLHLEAHELVYPKGWLLQKNLDVNLPIQ